MNPSEKQSVEKIVHNYIHIGESVSFVLSHAVLYNRFHDHVYNYIYIYLKVINIHEPRTPLVRRAEYRPFLLNEVYIHAGDITIVHATVSVLLSIYA